MIDIKNSYKERAKKASETRRRNKIKEIEEAIKNKKQFGDYIVTQYIDYIGRDIKSKSKYGYVIKIKCLKCGYERITSFYRIKNLLIKNKLLCNHSKDEYLNIYINENLESAFKNGKYIVNWVTINRNCNKELSSMKTSRCKEKNIQVCKEWRFIKSKDKGHYLTNINSVRYKNFEKFIDSLFDKFGYKEEDLKNRIIRIERIDKEDDFKPSNMCIRVIGKGEILY